MTDTAAILESLTAWDTPTLYNGWEQITEHDPATTGFNLEALQYFGAGAGTIAGAAVTVTIQPSNPRYGGDAGRRWREYRAYVAGTPGPKIVIVQDLDQPHLYGSFWGEVNASVHTALGCVGSVTDGGVRDLEAVAAAGFTVLARRPCVGHAHVTPVSWGETVEVFGVGIRHGDAIVADRHGFLVIPAPDLPRLAEAAAFMDGAERSTIIAAAKDRSGTIAERLARIEDGATRFRRAVDDRFGRGGEF